MSMLDSIRKQITPIHPEGYIFIALFAIVALVLHWLWEPLGWLGAFATLWCAYFFRDPPRVTPLQDGLVVSPADGIVCSIGSFMPPAELGLGAEPMQRVSVFMSVFDCHVNRAPVTGRISRIAYKPGLFLNADLDKASEDNERNGLIIDSGLGRFGVVQIAGLIGRRTRADGSFIPGEGAIQAARPARPAAALCRPQCRDPAGALRRTDGDSFRHRGPF